MNARAFVLFFAIATMLVAEQAHASLTPGGPIWEGPLFTIMESVTGALGRAVSAIAIAVAGWVWLFGGHERGMRNVLGLAIGIALTLGTVQVMDALGFGGAIL